MGWRKATSSSPTVSWVRFRLSQATRKPTPPWMGTVRSAWSLMVSKGRRSSSQRSQCSILAARASSSFRRGVTLGREWRRTPGFRCSQRRYSGYGGLSAPRPPLSKREAPGPRCTGAPAGPFLSFGPSRPHRCPPASAAKYPVFAGLTAAFLVFIVLSYLRGVPQSFSRSSRPWGSARSKSSHISCVHTAVPAAAVRSTLVRC